MNQEERDLLLSAVLDGVASSEETDLVLDDAELVDELNRMQAVRDRLTQVVAPGDVIEEQVSVAMAEFDRMGVAPATSASHRAKTHPANARPARSRPRRPNRFLPIVAAAATVLIVVVGIVITDDSGDDLATNTLVISDGTPEGAEEAQLEAADSFELDATGGDEPSESRTAAVDDQSEASAVPAGAPAPHFGPLLEAKHIEELWDLIVVERRSGEPAAQPEESADCPAWREIHHDPALVYEGDAMLDGVLLRAMVLETEVTEMVLLDLSDCTEVARHRP